MQDGSKLLHKITTQLQLLLLAALCMLTRISAATRKQWYDPGTESTFAVSNCLDRTYNVHTSAQRQRCSSAAVAPATASLAMANL
jgi:hypothetical protein